MGIQLIMHQTTIPLLQGVYRSVLVTHCAAS